MYFKRLEHSTSSFRNPINFIEITDFSLTGPGHDVILHRRQRLQFETAFLL